MGTYYGLVMPEVYTGGVYIKSIKQTKESHESLGVNEITATLTNRHKEVFLVRNGESAAISKVSATADTLAPGSDATAEAEASGDDNAKEFTFRFGIPKGEPFAVYRTFPDIPAMNADTSVPEGKFVVIASDVSDDDNAKLFVRTADGYSFITDLSGAQGIKGETGATPYISASATVDANTGTPAVDVRRGGTAESPSFTFEFRNLKGDKGETDVSGLLKIDGSNATAATANAIYSKMPYSETAVTDQTRVVCGVEDKSTNRTPLGIFWNWIKGKLESVAHSPLISTLRYSVGGRTGEILNATGDVSSGVKLVIGAGGPTIVGGGESAAAVAAGITTDTEVLHLTSDETVKIQTNIQNGIANAKTTTFNKDGSISTSGHVDITNAENSNSAAPVKAIGGKMAANDFWRVAAGGTTNNGFVELATADDGSEPIKVAQYTGAFATKVREATLLDGSGNTHFPGTLTAGGYQQKRLFTISTEGLPSGNFYPVTFPSADTELDCEIHSRNVGGGDPYNQNVLHFLLTSQGWSDTPYGFTVLHYGVYDSGETTIGSVGIGQHNGVNAVWVRGGNTYRFICNRTPTLRTSTYTEGDETFSVGTFASGTDINTNVLTVWDPRHIGDTYDAQGVNSSIHAYVSGALGILPNKSDPSSMSTTAVGIGKPPRNMFDNGADGMYSELNSGAYLCTGAYDESGGIIVSGEGVDIWAPPDTGLVRFWNEDSNEPVAAIDGEGKYIGVAANAESREVRVFYSWLNFQSYLSSMTGRLTSHEDSPVDGISGAGDIHAGLYGFDVCSFVKGNSVGDGAPSSSYSQWFVETRMVSESDGDSYTGMQVAWGVTSGGGRTAFRRFYQDGWGDWSSNDL